MSSDLPLIANEPKIKVVLRLTRIRINSQGYDSCGGYWGVGERLYEYARDEDYNDPLTQEHVYKLPYALRNGEHIRARNRDEAKEVIRHAYRNYPAEIIFLGEKGVVSKNPYSRMGKDQKDFLSFLKRHKGWHDVSYVKRGVLQSLLRRKLLVFNEESSQACYIHYYGKDVV